MKPQALTPQGQVMLETLARINNEEARQIRHAKELETLLQPETVAAIAALGQDALAVANHWSQWPKRVLKLEAEGRLLPEIKAEAETWQRAREFERENAWMGGIETKQLMGVDLTLPPPA